MKIDGQEYNFNIQNVEISSDEIPLNNSVLKSIFELYDVNNDKKLSQQELKNAFDEFTKMDNDATKGALSDNEIKSVIKTYKQKIQNITINDLKTFIKELSVITTAKNLASRLKNQISWFSFNKKTTALLGEINNTNASEVINSYKKLTGNTLANDVDNEWGLDIDTVKKYICKPLVEQAKILGIKLSDEEQYTKINDIETLNSYIATLTDLIIYTKKQKQAKLPNFGEETSNLIKQKYPHKTKLLKIAQDSLGIIEVTKAEYETMSESEKEQTQMKIVGKYNGSAEDSWCAYTVSYLAEQAGMNIGAIKSSVYKNKQNSWVSWAKKNNTWNSIPTHQMTNDNYIEERTKREQAIKKQLNKMHEGDFIVWASQYIVSVDGDKELFKSSQSSHIGIIEAIDTKKGTVTVIEGNANISKQGENTDRILVTEKSGDPIGNQLYGEYKEVNLRDGLIRKVYTLKDLANFGYSGFIDNSKIIK